MGNKCPAELTEAHLGQKDSETQIQQPSYSQILKGTQNQPPDQGKHFKFLHDFKKSSAARALHGITLECDARVHGPFEYRKLKGV